MVSLPILDYVRPALEWLQCVWSLQSLDFWCCYRPGQNVNFGGGEFRSLGEVSPQKRCLDKTLYRSYVVLYNNKTTSYWMTRCARQQLQWTCVVFVYGTDGHFRLGFSSAPRSALSGCLEMYGRKHQGRTAHWRLAGGIDRTGQQALISMKTARTC